MTDEGRAEEYVTTIQHDVNNWGGKEPTERFYNEIKLKQAYLYGLAEGRKELEQWKQEWQDAQIKANEEGFARTTLQIKYSELEKENAELKKQIDQLSNDNHVLKTSFIMQQEQIEKMKNCSNCNGIKPNGMRSEKCDFCFKGKDFINWEPSRITSLIF